MKGVARKVDAHSNLNRLCTRKAPTSIIAFVRSQDKNIVFKFLKTQFQKRHLRISPIKLREGDQKCSEEGVALRFSSSSTNSSTRTASLLEMKLDDQRQILDLIGEKIGVRGTDLSAWYSIDFGTLIRLGAWKISEMYDHLPYRMLSAVYPKYEWFPQRFKFKALPPRDPTVVEAVLTSVEERLGISDPDQWYRVTREKLIKLGVYDVFRYNGGRYKVLKNFRPTVKWIAGRFLKGGSISFTGEPESIKEALSHIEKHLNIQTPEDWYRVKDADLKHLGLDGVIRKNGNLFKLLQMYKPTFDWIPWKFDVFPKTFISDPNIIMAGLAHVEKELAFKSVEDWYSVTHSQLSQIGMEWLVRYEASLYRVLKQYRPSVKWIPWKFTISPKKVISDPELIKSALTYVESSLNLKDPNGWYEVRFDELNRLGLAWLIHKNGNLYKILKDYRPEIQWLPWRFNRVPKGVVDDPEAIRLTLDHVEKTLGLTQPEDWYRVSYNQLNKLGVARFFLENGGRYKLLKSYRSKFNWIENKFVGSHSV